MEQDVTHTNIYVKHLTPKPGQVQLFQVEFVEELMRMGIEGVEAKDCSGWIRKQAFRLKGLLKRALTDLMSHRRNVLVVPCRGDDIHYKSLPYYPDYDIVPMVWDAWPVYWPKMFKALKMLRVKLCLCSSRQVADVIKQRLGIEAVWIPEGIDTAKYVHHLKPLEERQIDVFEMGRHHDRFHAVVESLIQKGTIHCYKGKKTDADGNLTELTFPTAESLILGMRNTKCMVCFPRCMTHPQVAGHIETLTLRYWESMLSGCLMIGHAPQELIDVVGYNPVVEVDWNDAQNQLEGILSNLAPYQALVQKNYDTALRHASWNQRFDQIDKCLSACY